MYIHIIRPPYIHLPAAAAVPDVSATGVRAYVRGHGRSRSLARLADWLAGWRPAWIDGGPRDAPPRSSALSTALFALGARGAIARYTPELVIMCTQLPLSLSLSLAASDG